MRDDVHGEEEVVGDGGAVRVGEVVDEKTRARAVMLGRGVAVRTRVTGSKEKSMGMGRPPSRVRL